MNTTTIQITMPSVARKRDFVAVERSEWEHLQQYTTELEHALSVIASGELALRNGKTRVVYSLRELMR